MNAIYTILIVLIILAAILLIAVVLLQNGKGEGLASNFVAGNQTFGVRKTADILEKITWGLVAFILVVSIISTFTTNPAGSAIDVSDQIENVEEQTEMAFPTSPVEVENPAEAPAETPAE